MRRSLTGLVTLPFAAASVLVGHWAAYRLAGAPPDDLHGYLAHVPQVLAILVLLGLVGLAREARARETSPLAVALLALSVFVVQEHVERLVHTGQLPFLLTSPVFLVGVALQLPVALGVWLLARRFSETIAASTRRRPPLGSLLQLVVAPPALLSSVGFTVAPHPGRGPPAHS